MTSATFTQQERRVTVARVVDSIQAQIDDAKMRVVTAKLALGDAMMDPDLSNETISQYRQSVADATAVVDELNLQTGFIVSAVKAAAIQ